MQANRRIDTTPERALRSRLHRRGLRFRKDLPVVANGVKTRPDLVFSGARVAVFVDGCFWHRCPEHFQQPRANAEWWHAKLDRNVERDRRADDALARDGWAVLRVWEHEDPDEAAVRVELLVRERAAAAR